ncbi:hypothetical protein UFOVP613_25 [uncultured Caudovirales phage]|uniref:Uncharacterized protein n=1 Tax=uncultured Caudovirales phage TaxID=2100421 RepID=A0A6J5N1P4_9CAUD|nr:hypothetical protein UFOVP613_25 [uncultured Caudovirales phage]
MTASAQVSVSTTAVRLIAGVLNETRQGAVHSSAAIYLGGDSSVTTATGYLLDTTGGNWLAVKLNPGEEIWAIKATGTATAYVLVSEL